MLTASSVSPASRENAERSAPANEMTNFALLPCHGLKQPDKATAIKNIIKIDIFTNKFFLNTTVINPFLYLNFLQYLSLL
jgi:hypothetical protein